MSEHASNRLLLSELKKMYGFYKEGNREAFEVAMKRLVCEFSSDRRKFAVDLENFPDEMMALYEGRRK